MEVSGERVVGVMHVLSPDGVTNVPIVERDDRLRFRVRPTMFTGPGSPSEDVLRNYLCERRGADPDSITFSWDDEGWVDVTWSPHAGE